MGNTLEGGLLGIPWELYTNIFTSWSSELPTEAPVRVKGGVSQG